MAGNRAADWQRVADFAEQRLRPAFTHVGAVSQLALHPLRDLVAGVGEIRDDLLSPSRSMISLFGEGEPTVLREGRRPVWSPDGLTLAHLDETGVQVGDFHRLVTGAAEALAWSPSGAAMLLVAADTGDQADDWAPDVQSTERHLHWRRLLVLDVASGELRPVGRPDLNIWDACWAGDGQVLAVCSDGSPEESAWYSADLRLLDIATGEDRVVAAPVDQLGPIAASPSGQRIAYVTSICSDRGIVAGDLQVLNLANGQTTRLAAPVDVSAVAFTDETQLGFAGLVGLETRIGFASFDGETRIAWSSQEHSSAGALPTAAFHGTRSAFVRVGYHQPPEVVLAGADGVRVLASLWPAPADPGVSLQVHQWSAPDELELEGWLQLPARPGPHPLITVLHGGPIGSHRSSWAPLAFLRPYLLELGYALFLPNPRGSIGRGQEFARAVVGDMGGADATDVTSGVTSLVDAGLADPGRLGVLGGSYGGFLSAWLITQCELFAAAVPLHPVCDWREQHGSSAMPAWDELFLDGKPYAADGQYVQRSPLTHAAAARTPTLLIAGGVDRLTPPGQALAMHRALRAHGVTSECVTYPGAAHGSEDLPSVIDQAARIGAWFQRWMPA